MCIFGIEIGGPDSYVAEPDYAPNEVTEEAEATARAYYSETVFQVVGMVCIKQSADFDQPMVQSFPLRTYPIFS